eukprot:Plantae.Rhodophyta-Purpureofilum_apyrenoidigerum.ctg46824.p1 GENE.Plantae.Rhodophyta-Purpureofilum_apyrenoidigerum.ctg46824~~Plantae.Rhodophyta-Purpureofilum_apyrenoidigerum.ctg46824.p1  ORF type:complete len:361 (-),score=60.97 Plantae.Rhodophyta-Purpureofilum_apyrenoidigerum.ctg46824:81-1163(-)
MMNRIEDEKLEQAVAEAASKLGSTSLEDGSEPRERTHDRVSGPASTETSDAAGFVDGNTTAVESGANATEPMKPDKYERYQRELVALCESLKHGEFKSVVVVTGAGVSTAAGIPDFRSENGLYQRLRKHNISRPELVFDISFFRRNPVPFYMLAETLHAENIKPTSAHYFIKLLNDKGLLRRLYTQNIDGLDHIAGVDKEKIVEAHGSFATARCIDCSKFATELAKQAMKSGSVPKCPQCKGYVKPDIVFFGEHLPEKFHRYFEEDARESDLCIVLGSSLQVYPVAKIPVAISRSVKRLLINREVAGDFGDRRGDILALGEIEEVVQDIVGWCGWQEDLHRLTVARDVADAVATPASANS